MLLRGLAVHGPAPGTPATELALLQDEAERVAGDRVETVPVADLAVGDLVLVRPGAGRRPGRRRRGRAGRIDDHRRVPAGDQGPGGRVVAGTVVTDSAVRVRVDAVGEQTALAGIRRLVAQAQASGSRAQALADRADNSPAQRAAGGERVNDGRAACGRLARAVPEVELLQLRKPGRNGREVPPSE